MVTSTLQSGGLYDRLEIQEQVAIVDSFGEHLGTEWTTVASCWGQVKPLRSRERIAAESMGSEIIAEIIIRPNSAITQTCRIRHAGRIYNVAGDVPPFNRRERVTLNVTAGLNDGT